MVNQIKTNVAILTGGNSVEKEISLASAKVVALNLDNDKFNICIVNISLLPWKVYQNNNFISEIDMNDFSCFVDNQKHKFDIVFMAIHGTPAEDGRVQGYFDLLKIPYTCSSALASAITFDKDVCKKLLIDDTIKQANSTLLNVKNKNIFEFNDRLSFPVFVKPNKNGSSYGTFKVYKKKELLNAIDKAFEFDDEVLIEEYIEGRELACSVYEQNGKVIALPMTEIISENDFFDYEAKYQGKANEITPANIPNTIKELAQRKAIEFFKRLKLSGFARVDYFLKESDLYILEVNTIPGLSKESILPQEVIASGMSLKDFFEITIIEAMNKNNNKAI